MTGLLNKMVEKISEMEMHIVCVERIKEYVDLEEEVRPSCVSLFFCCRSATRYLQLE